MTHELTVAETIVALYGGLGGVFGMACAEYLHRMRPTDSQPVTVLSTFAIGFALMMSATLMATNPPDWVALAVVALAYTLLILAEVALFGADVHPQLTDDIHKWAVEKPHFVHPERIEDAEGDDRPDMTN
jgi:uncharacterized membrane protein YfcA